MKLKVIVPLIIVLFVIVGVVLLNTFYFTSERHIFNIMSQMEKSEYSGKDYIEDSINVRNKTIRYKIPSSASILKQENNSKSYYIGKGIVNISLSEGEGEAKRIESSNTIVFKDNNYKNFIDNNSIIKYQIGSHTYYKTLISNDGQILFQTNVSNKYDVAIHISTNAKSITKDQLQGIMDFE